MKPVRRGASRDLHTLNAGANPKRAGEYEGDIQKKKYAERKRVMVNGTVQEKNGLLYTVISYYDKDGVRKQKWQTTGLDARGNLRKAKEILKERIDDMENELEYVLDPTKRPDIPFSRFLSDWLETVKSTILITTYSSYLYFVDKRINPYFDEKKITLQNIRTSDIQEYYNTMLKRGIKWNSVNKHHAVIRRALDYAVKMEYIPSNPALKIEPPKRQKYIAEHYDRDELQALFEAIKGDPIEVPVILSAFYGLRRSEAIGLKWSAVDFKEKTRCIRHTVCMMGMDGKRVVVQKDTTKNKASLRTLPLMPEIEELLIKTKKAQTERQKLCRDSYNKDYLDYICVDQFGNLLTPDFVTHHFNYFLKKHDMKHIRFHDLRHSCASLLLANGVSLKEIQDWLGHSDFGTTANIYSHLEYGAKMKSAETMAQTLTLGEKKEED